MDVIEDILGALRDRFQNVYLFGSRARGDYLQGSDIDIIVVDSSFEGISYLERTSKVRRVIREVLEKHPIDVDVIALTPDEFRDLAKRRTNIVGYAMKRGEIIEA